MCSESPIVAGDKTIIPVAKIAYGFGGGTGSGGLEIKTARGEGGGGGGGVGALPVGVFEVGPQGTRFVAVGDKKKLLGTLLLGAALGSALRAAQKKVGGKQCHPERSRYSLCEWRAESKDP